MWLTDLLHAQPEIRPTRPTSENDVGRPESLVYVGSSDTSDTSDTKNSNGVPNGDPPGPVDAQQTTFSEVSYKNPESVRHFPLEDDPAPATQNRFEAHWRACCDGYPAQCPSCPDADLIHADGPMAGHLNSNFCRRHSEKMPP